MLAAATSPLIVLLLLLRHLLTLMLSLVFSFLPMFAGLIRFTGLLLKLGSPWPPTLFGPMFVGSFRILLRLGFFLFHFTLRLSFRIRHKSPKGSSSSQGPF
jgi:hypothetical protein